MSSAHPHLPTRTAALLLTALIGTGIVGYLVGIRVSVHHEPYDPAAFPSGEVADADADEEHVQDVHEADAAAVDSASVVMPAASYSEMRRQETGPTSRWEPILERIPTDYDYQRCITCHDPHLAKPQPSEEEKLRSLSTRATRRAFNGAPPVVPHAVERTDDAACYACHGQGARVGDRVANRMSHRLLVNCLQCHAVPAPKPFAPLEIVAANSFAGLPAPTAGQRAYPGAPPVIPHSTSMREQCLSCHGGVAGWPGLQVTHRWRTNCLQCHALSSPLDQPRVADIHDLVTALGTQQP